MPQYFDFTVSLQDVLPRPWRRFLIGAGSRFAALHTAIQESCGWASSHMYVFRAASAYDHGDIAGLRVGDGSVEDAQLPDAGKVQLARFLGPEKFTSCLYLYDFGDNWTHDVQLNDVVDLPEQFTRRLLGADHIFPPDDCGGGMGFARIQQVLRTGSDPEGLLNWAREVWGWTGAFDLEEVRRRFDVEHMKPAGRKRK